ncbi:MAG: hypothetical protein ACI9LY_000679 [Arenicella sp.]|jgi:hypothetical protein
MEWAKKMTNTLFMNTTAAAFAAIVLFIWNSISWTVLPWQDLDVHQFTDQAEVMQSLLDHAPASGIYYIPGDDAAYTPSTPTAFVNVLKEGYQVGMEWMMIVGLLTNFLFALVAVSLLGRTSGLSFKQRVGFVTGIGLVIGLAGNLPHWNWFGFPILYTLVQIMDSVIMWFLAGLVLARLVPE